MITIQSLSDFFAAIEKDPRIGLSHISLYCALLQYFNSQPVDTALLIHTPELMKLSKISGLGTYHKCIRDLHDFGYIKYKPSHNHSRRKTLVYLSQSLP